MGHHMSFWVQFETIFTSTELVIPAAQMGIYVVIINMMMLCNYYKACYIISLSFSFYWLFLLNQKIFVNSQGEVLGGLFYYLIFGSLFMIAVLISLFTQKEKE
jgi:hypothetical protein